MLDVTHSQTYSCARVKVTVALLQHEREMRAAVLCLTDATSAAEALMHEAGGHALSYMELQYDRAYLTLQERHLVT